MLALLFALPNGCDGSDPFLEDAGIVDAAAISDPKSEGGLDASTVSDAGLLDDALIARLETALERGVAASGASSAICAVEIEGQGRWIGIRGDEATSTEMPFRIGSVTKMFVAAIALQIIEEGMLSLDDTLDAWFDSVPNANEITVGQMLQHTSGMFDYVQSRNFRAGVSAMPQRRITVDDILGYVIHEEPTFAPGMGWSYSNTNYYLLGAILERVSGQTFAELLRARIGAPLRLTMTTYEVSESVDGLLPGYGAPFASAGIVTDLYDLSLAGAAGGIASNASDMLTFLSALRADTLIPASERDAWLSMVPARGGVEYGLGVMSFPLPGHRSIGHDGSIWGYKSFAVTLPDDNISIFVVLNDSAADVNGVLVEVFDALHLL